MIRSAATEAANSQIEVPSEAAVSCFGAPLPQGPQPSTDDYRMFGVLQTGRLAVCEQRRALAVDTIKLHNTYAQKLVEKIKPKPWWKLW